MLSSITSYPVRCMYGDGAEQGGAASVHYLGDVSLTQFDGYAAALFSETAPLHSTEVLVARSADGYLVESYSASGRQIQFCGHGALAAAFVVFEQLEPAAELLSFSNHYQSWHAQRSAGGVIALLYSRPNVEECPLPDFAAAVLGAPSTAAAVAGGSAGYLLLVVADAAIVQRVQPDLQRLALSTECALIITAFNAAEATCWFRYFAPQYGTPEDTATGSAAVQLAAFWQSYRQVDDIVLRQLSAGGALLATACRGDQVELSALVGYR
jgi:predicted PhzF superfamily epimerase YddE/YHI9